MATFFWVFIAFTLGFILYSSIQDEIPDEFSFFKLGGPSSSQTAASSAVPANVKVSQYKGWTIKNDGYSVELSHSLVTTTPAIGPASLARAPEIGILCNRGILDLKLDAGDSLIKASPTTTVVKIGELSDEWDLGRGGIAFPKIPNKFLQVLKSTPQHRITVKYEKHAVQHLSLDTVGLAELLAQLPRSCQ